MLVAKLKKVTMWQCGNGTNVQESDSQVINSLVIVILRIIVIVIGEITNLRTNHHFRNPRIEPQCFLRQPPKGPPESSEYSSPEPSSHTSDCSDSSVSSSPSVSPLPSDWLLTVPVRRQTPTLTTKSSRSLNFLEVLDNIVPALKNDGQLAIFRRLVFKIFHRLDPRIVPVCGIIDAICVRNWALRSVT